MRVLILAAFLAIVAPAAAQQAPAQHTVEVGQFVQISTAHLYQAATGRTSVCTVDYKSFESRTRIATFHIGCQHIGADRVELRQGDRLIREFFRFSTRALVIDVRIVELKDDGHAVIATETRVVSSPALPGS